MNRETKIANSDSHPSRSVTTRDGATILDIENYSPFLLNAVSNAWQRVTSAIYREKFNLGIVDWRVIAMLQIEPDITANRICTVVRLDKSAVSRTLRLLLERELVAFEAKTSDPRKRTWRLSQQGERIHDQILLHALEAEGKMTQGISVEDHEAFLRVMRRMLNNLESL